MITIFTGAPGAGKSSLSALFLKRIYKEEGRKLQKLSAARIDEINKTRRYPLTPPPLPPIYSDFKVKIPAGYKKHYEPYYINGYYMGLANERLKTQFLPPYAKVFLGESQRYYNSRKSGNFPDFVSRFYEMHRHYGLDLYLDVQRVRLIDPNIRELCRNFIEVQGMEHTRDKLGRIIHTVWRCREFSNWQAYEDYLNTGAVTYKETSYENDGNIFDCYDSFSFFENYLPEDVPGKDISYLKHLTRAEARFIGADNAEFYKGGEPAAYRKAPEAPKIKDKTNAEQKQQSV